MAESNLCLLTNYKKKNNRTIYPREIFFRDPKMVISPMIFTKQNKNIRYSKTMTAALLAFENYLTLVTQLYYKRNFKNSNPLEEALAKREGIESTNDSDFPLPIKTEKRGRKPKPKTSGNPQGENMGNTTMTAGQGFTEESKDNEQILEAVNANNSVTLDILDNLVSPLREDLTFGTISIIPISALLIQLPPSVACIFYIERWSPKEIAIFESCLCKYGKNFPFIQFIVKESRNITLRDLALPPTYVRRGLLYLDFNEKHKGSYRVLLCLEINVTLPHLEVL